MRTHENFSCPRFPSLDKSLLSPYLPVVFLTAALVLFLTGCSLTGIPGKKEECKIRTYVDVGLLDYISSRYHSGQAPRIAIIPFEVPETFAPAGKPSINYGRELAHLFHQELLRGNELSVVEIFDRNNWPGKKAEFFTGDYTALQLARNAGYDFLILGYMEEINNESDITILTRAIDLSNNVTVWYARSTVSSNERVLRRTYSYWSFGFLMKDQPELFAFPERSQLLIRCTVNRLLTPPKPEIKNDSVLPEILQPTAPPKQKVPM